MYVLTPGDVITACRRTEHAVGEARKSVVDSVTEILETGIRPSRSHMFCTSQSRSFNISQPSGSSATTAEPTLPLAKCFGSPRKETVMRAAQRVRVHAAKDAMRWRIGNAYDWFLREAFVLAVMREMRTRRSCPPTRRCVVSRGPLDRKPESEPLCWQQHLPFGRHGAQGETGGTSGRRFAAVRVPLHPTPHSTSIRRGASSRSCRNRALGGQSRQVLPMTTLTRTTPSHPRNTVSSEMAGSTGGQVQVSRNDEELRWLTPAGKPSFLPGWALWFIACRCCTSKPADLLRPAKVDRCHRSRSAIRRGACSPRCCESEASID